MRKFTTILLMGCVAATVGALLDAQSVGQTGGGDQISKAPTPGMDAVEFPLPELAVPFEMVAMQALGNGEAITGQPFSAETITEVRQTLHDGNRIRRQFKGRLYRDGMGRTRREQTLATVGPLLPHGITATIVITDPVAGISFMLDPENRTAMRMPLLQIVARDRPSTPSTNSSRRATTLPQLDIDIEALGESVQSGVPAVGRRVTTILPTGIIGNERPIRIVNETWRSETLNVLVASRRTDPRFADVEYKLLNVALAEPSSELFQVPRGYSVRDMDPAVTSGGR